MLKDLLPTTYYLLSLTGLLLLFCDANAGNPDELRPATPVKTLGPFTWTFLREVEVPKTPFYQETVAVQHTNEPPKQLADSLVGGMLMLDEAGVWQITGVDETLLDPSLLEMVDEEISNWRADEEFSSEVEYWTRDNYSVYSCGGVSGRIRLWDDTETRVKQMAPFTDRQQSSVYLSMGCSGVLLRPNWVLTAAHCVIDDNGSWTETNTSITLHDVFGNSVQSSLIFSNTGYLNSQSYGDDWALVKMSSPFSSAPSDVMDLYTGPDSTYTDIDDHVHNLAYPAFTFASGGCLTNDNGAALPKGRQLYHQGGAEVSAVKTKRLKYKSDNGPGASGSGYYFCPEGADSVCGAGEEGRVIGVHAGYTKGVTPRHVGPKSTNFAAQAISIMNSN